MRGNRTAGDTRLGYRGGRLPNGFNKLSKDQIISMAKSGSEEEDALKALGLNPEQIERAKINYRWRRVWDKARAEWKIEKNKEINSSSDVRILSLLANKTMPDADLPDLISIEVDAPKYILESLKNTRAVKIAQSTD